MKEYLINKIKTEYKNENLIFENFKEKILIKDLIYKGINVELMPNNSNDFTIRFGRFEFFDKQAFESYFRKNLVFEDVKFAVNSNSIYAYVHYKKDNNFKYEAFQYTVKEILKIISSIKNILNG